MINTGIIQLLGVDGDPVALYAYNPSEMSEQDAIDEVESAYEDAHEQYEEQDLGSGLDEQESEESSVSEIADDILESKGITRVLAGEASTTRV